MCVVLLICSLSALWLYFLLWLHFPLSYFSIPPSLSCFQACEIPDTVIFSLAPTEESSLSKPCSVPYWDLIQSSVHGKVELPLPLKHMLFSLFRRPESAVSAWSLPAPIRPDFPRQSLSVPEEPDSGGGLRSRWVKQSICGLLAVTVHLEQGTKPRLAEDIKWGGAVCGHSLLTFVG